MFSVPRLATFVLATAVLLVSVSCESSLDPLEEKAGRYSVYGALNLQKDTNYVRVKNLNLPLSEEGSQQFNATVRLEHLESGSTEVLPDSIVVFEGVRTHNFQTTMDIVPDTRYQVTVDGAGGGPVQVTGTTPKVATTDVDPTREDCRTPLEISFEPVTGSVEMSIGVYYGNRLRSFTHRISSSEGSEKASLVLTPEQILKRALGKNLAGDRLDDPVRCHDLSRPDVQVNYNVYGPDFFDEIPSGDPSLPKEFGRFGGFYRGAFSFKIDTEDIYRST